MLENIVNLGRQLLLLSISVWAITLIGNFGNPSVIIGAGLISYGLLNVLAYVYRCVNKEGFVALIVALKETLIIGFGYSYVIGFEETMHANVWLPALVIYIMFTFDGNDQLSKVKRKHQFGDSGDQDKMF